MTPGPGLVAPPAPATELALEKLTRVLGDARGQKVYAEVLEEMGLTELRTYEDLHGFGRRLTTRAGFEAAVGGLLVVASILRGARP